MRDTMSRFVWALTAALVLHVIGATGSVCPTDPNCICGGTLPLELKCNIDGNEVDISLLPKIYLTIKCSFARCVNYCKLPQISTGELEVKSVTFKDCPLPTSSFNDVLTHLGVTRTSSLIFQNSRNLTDKFNRKHFEGLENVTKLLLSVTGATLLPDDLFMDMQNLTWLNIRSHGNNLSESLFKPLERLETLEISHNNMTNITPNMFSHLSSLRKLSLLQYNVTAFPDNLFTGIEGLEELDLNGLNELPTTIFNPLKSLKKLTMFSNKFALLPSDLFKKNQELHTVIILNNDVKLNFLPNRLFKAKPKLKEIEIKNCGIVYLPRDVFTDSTNLTKISIVYNDLQKLPEDIFNNQINLLELDLSHNNIYILHPKLFSSLVKLETLKLSFNNIRTIAGSTFTPLLSLNYFEITHNQIQRITPYMFKNNKQRMFINMAYNNLTSFKNYISPFAQIHNMKMLNLSHNQLENTLDDWFFNGHEVLDISYNKIYRIPSINMNDEFELVKAGEPRRDYYERPLRELYIQNNSMPCNCEDIQFLYNWKHNYILSDCYATYQCYELGLGITLVSIGYSFLALILMLICICLIKPMRVQLPYYMLLKGIMARWFSPNLAGKNNIFVIYEPSDEEFVLKEIIPKLLNYKNVSVHPSELKDQKKYPAINLNNYKRRKQVYHAIESDVKIIVFSASYLFHLKLKSVYNLGGDVSEIKKTLDLKKNTIYVYTNRDLEQDVREYALLKQGRCQENSLFWGERNFWELLMDMIDNITNPPKAKKHVTFGEVFVNMFNRSGSVISKKESPLSEEYDISTPTKEKLSQIQV